ncbi:MAG: formate--tetrahydrofolate ligase [Clostridiales bacterium]|nr:formate--tetrahydrofolate ligase [Clostridiales bacterium]
MKTDIEIAYEANPQPIEKIAAKIGIKDVYRYGDYVAKVSPKNTPKAKLILVTAINPTPAGEGKSTVSIGLADGMNKIGKKTALALREPSLGPVFGMKGGATGGGMAQIIPMDDINLHFTGDLHAITAANNLLCAMVDNSIYFGNPLKIAKVTFNRCMDCNDRALRNIVVALGGNGQAREDGFNITAASEVMATLCLAADFDDLKVRLGRIIIGYDYDGKPVTAKDLGANEAMAVLLKDAAKPNLVQTLEGTPAFVHGGPFANIAHGCNSVIATKTAMSYADYVVTEAGFGADLGAEKFFDIKCRTAGLNPSATVIVATIRALKYGGNGDLAVGMGNLVKHIENIKNVFSQNTVVAINKFTDDTEEDIAAVKAAAKAAGATAVLCECWGKGGEGAVELAEAVVKAASGKSKLTFTYNDEETVVEKVAKVATRIYGAKDVVWTAKAKKSLEKMLPLGVDKLPVCVAKTQYSLSDDAKKLGRPEGFTVTVRDVQYRAGAGFVVAVAGDILLMPGLPRVPNAVNMKIEDGKISGLF